jgi:adenine deaminase
MAHAVNRLVDIGGGVVLVEGDRVLFELPLPIAGLMSRRPLTEVAARERGLAALLAARGHASHDPLYSLLFMTADFLPSARLTALGVWDVRRGRVLRPSVRGGR